MIKKKNLTSKQVQEILKRYPNERAVDISADYNVSVTHIYKTAHRYGVCKSEEFRSSPASGRIQKGQRLSPNTEFKKGVSNPGRNPELIIKNKIKRLKWKESLFKKGHKPYNTAKDGEIRFRPGVGYYFIRIAENNWEFYHRHLWKKHHGSIPEGHNILFKDGNKKNCVIENLECISNSELGEKNRHTKYPYELQKAIEDRNRLSKLLKDLEDE